jgi:beta-glucosidase-like glycosyl hydrolase
MCSYNRINGLHASENKTYLTDILRDEWGFDGVVMSDWGAVNDRVKGLCAGLDLEMPGSYGVNDREIVAAVEKGSIPMKTLDTAVERILTWIEKAVSKKQKDAKWDKEADHELAGKIEEESAVLLKNEGVLPLDKNDMIAVIRICAKRHLVKRILYDPQEHNRDRHNEIHTCADRKANPGCHPDACGSRQALNITANFNDDARTQERNTAHCLCGYPCRICSSGPEFVHCLYAA